MTGSTVEEILLFLEGLDGIGSTVKSDHILNLFEDMEGKFPQDKEKMTAIARDFLAMPAREQMLYRVGRRIGLFSGLGDLEAGRARTEEACADLGIRPDNADEVIDEIMKRFI